ncbi:DUF6443 domain-containing protein [Taibaiella koreensis]|uniref:DUF6443 domain-containing protein n=1 Tax=Taibaiella koreensis TaxID=1268548 RepID=UPI0013C35290|nr:RHS repeat-associated core domain-containing protein [Taibaiella koreensis]
MKFYINSFLLAVACLGLSSIHAQNLPVLSETAPAGAATELPVHPGYNLFGDDNNNYVRTFIPFIPIDNEASITESSAVSDVGMSTTYFNGAGEGIQTIVRNFNSSGKKNLVIPYDNRSLAGKQYEYLPYANTAGFTVSPFSEQKSYYASLYPGEGYTAYSGVVNVSSATKRGEKHLAPGKSFIGQDEGTTSLLKANEASTIRIWKLNASKKPASPGYYKINELFGNMVTDEEGHISEGYTDKSGRLVYKQIVTDMVGVVPSVTFTISKKFYVYDEAGRLRYIIPPNAAEAIGTSATTISDAILNSLCFQYQYDTKGRMSAYRKPGQGDFQYYVYDRYKRIVMRQTPTEKAAGQWEIMYYDKSDRMIATSLLNSTQSRDAWQASIDAPPGGLTASNILYYLASDAGEGIVPGETTVTGNTIMSYTYYDSYAKTLDNNNYIYNLWLSTQGFSADLLSVPGAEIPVRSLRTHGMVTGSKQRILRSADAPAGIGDWTQTVYYYDDKGRQIGVASFHKLASESQTVYRRANFVSAQFDFGNRLLLAKHTSINQLNAQGASTHSELNSFEYETGTGRLLKQSHKVDDGGWQILSIHDYDELGNEKRQVLGNYGEVQDLSYNIRGQLTGINAIYAETGNKGGESRSFGQSLKYDYGFSKRKLDGNITGMIWRGASGNAMAYGYNYDHSGRLKAADYRKWEVNTTYPSGAWASTWTDYSVSNLAYDANGNIKSMKQRGMGIPSGGSSIVPVDMDRLNYVYEANSNRLLRVEDTVTYNYALGDFVNNNSGTNDYTYDANGNLSKDKNKKVDTIIYNHFNKPVSVAFSNGNKIQYSYDAEGSRIYEIINDVVNGKVNKLSYIGNQVYRDDTLQYSYTPVGRTVYDNMAGTNKEEFFVKDHLGNIRSVVDVYMYPILEYLGTYEVASAGLESLYFDHHVEISEANPSSTDVENRQAGRVNGSQADHRVGTALLMRVMAGDKVEMMVNSFYEGYNPGADAPVNASVMLGSILSTLTAGVGGLGGSESHNPQLVNQVFNGNNYAQFTNIVNSTTNPSRPKAYLNYVLFSENMQIVSSFSGAFQANGNGTWSEIGTTEPLVIPANGYLAVYLNGFSTIDVFFDQMVLRFTRGKLKEETHYYPHGLPMGNIGMAASGFKDNRHRYQGNANQTELGLNTMDFDFRQYDAQIGRFNSIDPLAGLSDIKSPYAAMSNNPVSRTDPYGLVDGNFVSKLLWDLYMNYGYWLDNVVVGGKSHKNRIVPHEGFSGGYIGAPPIWARGAIGNGSGRYTRHSPRSNGGSSGNASGKVADAAMPNVDAPVGDGRVDLSEIETAQEPNMDAYKRAAEMGLMPMPSDAQSMGAMCDAIAATEVPVLSQIADAASAGFSIYQGDYVGAGLSAAGILVPSLSQMKAGRTVARLATRGARGTKAAKRGSRWVYGAFKSEAKWAGQLSKRGWTAEQITEAVKKGKSFDAVNMVNKANSATRYVHPTTGQSVVIDNLTRELLHVGGPGFIY